MVLPEILEGYYNGLNDRMRATEQLINGFINFPTLGTQFFIL